MATKKKVLLTGASGTVGFEALKQLHERKDKYDITVFDLETPKARKKFKPYLSGVNLVYGNIFNEEDIKRIGGDFDAVIHLAAIIPPLADEQPKLSYNVNTLGTKKLIAELERTSPDAFFLFSSSISVYGDRLKTPYIKVTDELIASPGDEYAKTKMESEKIIQNSNLDWSIFRLSAIMGGHKISKLMFHQPLQTALEISTPRDTARAFVKAIEKREQLSKRIFNLGSGENCRITYEDFLTRSFDMFGLGKLDFAPKSFAEKNFHCGYYADGDELNDILDFRQDSLEDYFEMERKKVSPLRKRITSLFKKPIKAYLQKKSEPLEAFKTKDKKMMEHYFETEG